MPPRPPVVTDSRSGERSPDGAVPPLPPQPAAKAARTAAATSRRMERSDRRRRPELRVERVAVGDRGHPLGKVSADRLEAGLERLADDAADLVVLLDADAAGGQCRGADAQPRRHRRRTRVEGHGVAVDGDADVVQPVLGLLAVELGVAEVDEHEVDVRAAREDVYADLKQLLGHRLRAGHGALLTLAEELGLRDLERDGLAGDHVLERPALLAGEDGGVDLPGVLLATDDHAAAGAAQRLV